MSSLNKTIEAVLEQEHKSVYGFCSAIEDSGKYEEDSRSCSMLAQGLRQWASYREQARKQYETLVRQAQDKINDIDNNQTLFWELDSDRAKEYNVKADTQVEIVRTVSYIIGLSNETLTQLFATVTKLQFNK